jgi:hypothetical protein
MRADLIWDACVHPSSCAMLLWGGSIIKIADHVDPADRFNMRNIGAILQGAGYPDELVDMLQGAANELFLNMAHGGGDDDDDEDEEGEGDDDDDDDDDGDDDDDDDDDDEDRCPDCGQIH